MNEDAEQHEFEIDETRTGRIDKILSDLMPDFSRARIQDLIAQKQVILNGKACKSASKKLQSGDVVSLSVPPPKDWYPKAENIPLDIIFEDEHLIVINKQAGLVVHPGAGNKDGTLVNALLNHCRDDLSGIGGVLRPGIVHRLDKETSGLMVVAKSDAAHKGLAAQFADRTLSRVYQALVLGSPMPPKGKVDISIGRHPNHRTKMAAGVGNGKEAVTHYKVLQTWPDRADVQNPSSDINTYAGGAAKTVDFNAALSLVSCKLESGRTHQIRVHMAHIGHPLIGDPMYSAQRTATIATLKKAGYEQEIVEAITNFPRQALHAYKLSFIHPVTEKMCGFECPLPQDFQALLKQL